MGYDSWGKTYNKYNSGTNSKCNVYREVDSSHAAYSYHFNVIMLLLIYYRQLLMNAVQKYLPVVNSYEKSGALNVLRKQNELIRVMNL